MSMIYPPHCWYLRIGKIAWCMRHHQRDRVRLPVVHRYWLSWAWTAPYCELPAFLPVEVNFKKIWMYIILLYHIRRKLRESLLCMFQGCAKVFFRSYSIAPQNK